MATFWKLKMNPEVVAQFENVDKEIDKLADKVTALEATNTKQAGEIAALTKKLAEVEADQVLSDELRTRIEAIEKAIEKTPPVGSIKADQHTVHSAYVPPSQRKRQRMAKTSDIVGMVDRIKKVAPPPENAAETAEPTSSLED
jgi:chromosome segregation ATPase